MNSRKPVPHHLTDSSQRYCVMTVVAPEGTNQKSEELCIRVHGCKESIAEANRWARKLRDSNTFFDVYVLKTNEWAPLPPRVDEIDSVNFTDGRVQAVFDSHREHQKGQKREMVERLAQAHEEKTQRAALKASEEFVEVVKDVAIEKAAMQGDATAQDEATAQEAAAPQDEAEGAEESKGE
ncbi:hypothetical protein JKP88DRAFT_173782 [Tribonema minus]|uniref:Uncharacterized protein n=1 Tax=Tribonema minus TaxID=303371 RepID=A0A835ZEC6_9STRA|nr:hypothetical protein JKP88DRAFT_173782 [Tribonema minus]